MNKYLILLLVFVSISNSLFGQSRDYTWNIREYFIIESEGSNWDPMWSLTLGDYKRKTFWFEDAPSGDVNIQEKTGKYFIDVCGFRHAFYDSYENCLHALYIWLKMGKVSTVGLTTTLYWEECE
jgi:hypothetical protein